MKLLSRLVIPRLLLLEALGLVYDPELALMPQDGQGVDGQFCRTANCKFGVLDFHWHMSQFLVGFVIWKDGK